MSGRKRNGRRKKRRRGTRKKRKSERLRDILSAFLSSKVRIRQRLVKTVSWVALRKEGCAR